MSRSACCFALTTLAVVLSNRSTAADEPPSTAIRAAVEKALPLLTSSATESTRQRDCFMCHHQAVSVVALDLARSRGFEVEADWFQDQAEHTEADLETALEDYKAGRGQPGGVTRAGYALWTLDAAGRERDETTTAVTSFLLGRDKDKGQWRTSSNRPPSEFSPFTSTFLAIRGLQAFGADDKKEATTERIASARDWLLKADPKENEDRVFRLWALKLADAPAEAISQAAEALRTRQRDDGGWPQLDDGDSDPYATATALVALHLGGGLSTDEPAYRRGLAFLIKTQEADGSWHVKSRSKPFQTYFESGFPHKADQFISCAASGWAASALVLALPERGGGDVEPKR